MTPFIEQVFVAARSRYDADLATGMQGFYQFMLPDANNYYLQICEDHCKLFQGVVENPCVTLAMESATLESILRGELNSMQAFMFGKITVTGDLEMAARLPSLFPR